MIDETERLAKGPNGQEAPLCSALSDHRAGVARALTDYLRRQRRGDHAGAFRRTWPERRMSDEMRAQQGQALTTRVSAADSKRP